MNIFYVSTFSLNNGIQILHEVIHINFIHQCLTMLLPVQLVSLHVCMWYDYIEISKNNSLASFDIFRIFIDPSSYNCPCITIWGIVPDGIVTTQVNIILLRQKIHVVNKTFQNLIKFVTRIISFFSPFLSFMVVANILNTFNLYP